MSLFRILIVFSFLLVALPLRAEISTESVSGSFRPLLMDMNVGSDSFFPDAPSVHTMQPGKIYNYSSADKSVNASAFVVGAVIGNGATDDKFDGQCQTKSVVRIISSADKNRLETAFEELKTEGGSLLQSNSSVSNSWDLSSPQRLGECREIEFYDNKQNKRKFYYYIVLTGCAVYEYHPAKYLEKDGKVDELPEAEQVNVKMVRAHENRHFIDFSQTPALCISPISGFVVNLDNIKDAEVKKKVESLYRNLEKNYAEIIIAAEARAVSAAVDEQEKDLSTRNIEKFISNELLTRNQLCQKYQLNPKDVEKYLKKDSDKIATQQKAVPNLFATVNGKRHQVFYTRYAFDDVLYTNNASMEELLATPENSYASIAASSAIASGAARIRILYGTENTLLSAAELKALGYTFADGKMFLCSYAAAYQRYYDNKNKERKATNNILQNLANEHIKLLGDIMSLYHKTVYYDNQVVGKSVKETSTLTEPSWTQSFNTKDIKNRVQWIQTFVLVLKNTKSYEDAERLCNQYERLNDSYKHFEINDPFMLKENWNELDSVSRATMVDVQDNLLNILDSDCFGHERLKRLFMELEYLPHNDEIRVKLLEALVGKKYDTTTCKGAAAFYRDTANLREKLK